MSGSRWIPLDVGYFHNPKARAAGKNGRALHLASSCWSADNLTDGKITKTDLPLLCVEAEVPRSTVAILVTVGLWCELDDGTGWTINDFLDHNKSKSEVEAIRRKWADKKAGQRSVSPGDSEGDAPGESSESLDTRHRQTDRQTQTTSYISDKTDDSLPGPKPSSSWNLPQQVAHQLARYQALDSPPENIRAWITPTRNGILHERGEEIATELARCNGEVEEVVIALRTRKPDPPKPARAPWYADPNCELCPGDGWRANPVDGYLQPCTCRKPEPYIATVTPIRPEPT